jgi:hypothetical protein
MRKNIKITLNSAAISPLRHGCYGRLELDAQQLTHALEEGIPQHSRAAMAAYDHLQRTVGLLNRIGWTQDDHRHQITLTDHADLQTAIQALREEAAAESAIRTAALEDNAPQDAERATRRELAIHDILTSLETAQADATVDRTTAAVTQQPASEQHRKRPRSRSKAGGAAGRYVARLPEWFS